MMDKNSDKAIVTNGSILIPFSHYQPQIIHVM